METVKTIQIKPITIVNSSSDAFVIESYTTFYSKHPQSFASLIFDEGEVPTAAEYLKGVEEAIADCKKSEGKTLIMLTYRPICLSTLKALKLLNALGVYNPILSNRRV